MIVCADPYAIFDLEELMILMGQPVRRPMRTDEEEFRKLHGLQTLKRYARTVPTARLSKPPPSLSGRSLSAPR